MRNWLTLFDWALWAGCISTQIIALRRSCHSGIKTLPVLLAYLLSESIILLPVALFSSITIYARAYYILGLAENLLLSAVAIELASKLLPEYRAKVLTLAPVTIAAPVFLAVIVLPPLRVESLMRLSVVGVLFSLVLLLLCFALERSSPELRRLSYAYASLLFLLGFCAEVQLRFEVYGIKMGTHALDVEIIRRLWPCAWVIGVGLVAAAAPAPRGSQANTG